MLKAARRCALVILMSVGWIVTSFIIAYSSMKTAIVLLLVAASAIWMSYRDSFHFTSLFLFFLPIVGFLNPLFHVNGCPLFLPILYAGFLGRQLRIFEGTSTDFQGHFSFPIKVYLSSAFFSVVVAVVPLLPLNGLHATIAATPWGEIRTVHAIGWILLSFFFVFAGPFFAEIVKEAVFVRGAKPLLLSLGSGMLIAFFLGVLQYGRLTKWGLVKVFLSGVPQFNATFTDPNALGLTSALLITIWGGAMLARALPAWGWGMIPILFFLVFISGSRAALLIVFIVVVCFGMGLLKKRPRWAALFFLFFIGSLVLFRSDQRSRFFYTQERIRQFFTGEISAKELLGDRTTLWRAGWVTAKHNLLLGVGLGLYLVRMPAYANELPSVVNDNAGNQYLQILAEQGLIGLLVFLFLMGSAAVNYIRTGRGDPLKTGCFVGLCGATVAFFFGAHLIHFEVTLVFWLLLALITDEHPARN